VVFRLIPGGEFEMGLTAGLFRRHHRHRAGQSIEQGTRVVGAADVPQSGRRPHGRTASRPANRSAPGPPPLHRGRASRELV